MFSRIRHPRKRANTCQIPSKNISDAKIRRMFAAGMRFASLPPGNSAQKDSGNQQQSRLPGNVSRFRVRHHRQQSRRRNQRHQAGSLRAVLAESQQQSQESAP